MRGHDEAGSTGERRLRWSLYAAVLLLNLVQQPGRITFDTKLDLQIAPGAFLQRSLSLWNPDSALGELQNQASGYAFPLAPLYLIGHVLHVPMWIWERGISALLMVLAFEGMRRVALAWGSLGQTGAWLAGLFFMLSPRLLSTVGALTGEALPGAVLPWTVLPLVLWLRGRMTAHRAVLLSVATIPFMGGQNATEVLAALTLPALLLVVNGLPWFTRVRVFAAWTAGAVAVSLWWLVPLLMLGRYGSPFLDYVESARAATDRIGWLSALRGTDHWVTLLSLGESTSWRAGYDLASSPVLLVGTTMAAVIGLLGLLSARLPGRRPLLVALMVGLFALTAGSAGAAGSLLDVPWTAALDGVLAPFRNVHKFDPVARLPLALGFAAAVQLVLRRPVGRRRLDRRPVGLVLAVLVAVPVLMASLPAFQGHLRDTGGFSAVPDSWSRAAAYLRAQPGVVRSLVLPSSGFAVQTWGRSIDEPMQVVAADPWSARTQTPLMPAGTIRWLDLVESVVAAGRPDPDFASVLARAGITHVIVRNDLDYRSTDAPPPEVVHRVLDNSPGLLNVARFGSSETLYPAVEVYAVEAGPGDARVRLFDAADSASVQGGSEAIGQLVADDVVSDDQAMVRVGARDGRSAGVLTDTMQRVERNFGGLHDVTSQVMTSSERFRTERAAHDYLYDPPGQMTVARYSGVSEVVASSSRGYADTFGPVLPGEAPYAAVDGSLATSWVASPYLDPRGAWIEVRFAHPTVLGPIHLQFDQTSGARVRRVAIDTDSGRRTAIVDGDGSAGGLRMETAPTRRLRVTVLDAEATVRPVTLEEITIGGIEAQRSLVVPGIARAGTTVSLRSPVQRPSCMGFYAGLSCRASYQRPSAEGVEWARDIQVGESGSWSLSGSVVATGGDPTAALLAPLSPAQVSLTASSWYGGDPATVPQNAFDGEPATTWVAAPDDERPVLELRWDRPRRITRVLPRLLAGSPGRLPDRVVVESDDGTQVITLGKVGTGLIEPVRTRFLRLTMIRDEDSTDSPIAVSELFVPGLEDHTYHAEPNAPTGSVCGFGPQIDIDGFPVLTRVRGSIGELLSGAPLSLEACGGAAGVRLRPGVHRLTTRNGGGFAVRDLTLQPRGAATTHHSPGTVRVNTWDDTRRSIEVDTDRAALLAVTQSLNPGWVATLHGKRLQPTEIDGWMQGWRVPAGANGIVQLRFTPQLPYLVGLFGGLLLALVVVCAAGIALLRPAPGAAVAHPDARPLHGPGAVAALVCLVLLSVPAAAGALVGAGVARTRGGQRVSAVVIALCGTAAVVLAVRGLHSSLVAPDGADLLIAVAFGIMAGKVLGDEWRGGGSDDG